MFRLYRLLGSSYKRSFTYVQKDLKLIFGKVRQHCLRYKGILETSAAEDDKHHLFCVYQLTMTLLTDEEDVILWLNSYFLSPIYMALSQPNISSRIFFKNKNVNQNTPSLLRIN